MLIVISYEQCVSSQCSDWLFNKKQYVSRQHSNWLCRKNQYVSRRRVDCLFHNKQHVSSQSTAKESSYKKNVERTEIEDYQTLILLTKVDSIGSYDCRKE